MTTSIGFIMVTHEKPNQIIRLIKRLNSMFDNPAIVCHHDYSKCYMPIDILPNNVVIVQPHLKTKWGEFSLVEAMIKALDIMYSLPESPDWFVLLSGADYPIKSGNEILHDLESSQYDAYMHYEKLISNINEIPSKLEWCNSPYGATYWHKLSYERYYCVNIQIPLPDRNIRIKQIRINIIKNPHLAKFFLPFTKELQCFFGEFWFCANRKSAKYLLEYHKTKPALAQHYKKVQIPDESYCQTILCNAVHLKVKNENFRYIDWSEGGYHPKTLTCEDLPKIIKSSAHFARKLDIEVDVRILDELDSYITSK